MERVGGKPRKPLSLLVVPQLNASGVSDEGQSGRDVCVGCWDRSSRRSEPHNGERQTRRTEQPPSPPQEEEGKGGCKRMRGIVCLGCGGRGCGTRKKQEGDGGSGMDKWKDVSLSRWPRCNRFGKPPTEPPTERTKQGPVNQKQKGKDKCRVEKRRNGLLFVWRGLALVFDCVSYVLALSHSLPFPIRSKSPTQKGFCVLSLYHCAFFTSSLLWACPPHSQPSSPLLSSPLLTSLAASRPCPGPRPPPAPWALPGPASRAPAAPAAC